MKKKNLLIRKLRLLAHPRQTRWKLGPLTPGRIQAVVVHVSLVLWRIYAEVGRVGEVGRGVDEVAGRGEVVATSVPVAVASFVDVGSGFGALGGRVVGFGRGFGFRGGIRGGRGGRGGGEGNTVGGLWGWGKGVGGAWGGGGGGRRGWMLARG
jgi:hypothetical protein